MGLISNLNAWENISLQAAYHGTHPVARIAKTAHDSLASLGADPQRFLARLPDEMDPFERTGGVRPAREGAGAAVIDGLGEGLNANRPPAPLASRQNIGPPARGHAAVRGPGGRGAPMSEEFQPPVRFPHLLAKVNVPAGRAAAGAHLRGHRRAQAGLVRPPDHDPRHSRTRWASAPACRSSSSASPSARSGDAPGPNGVDVQLAIMSEHMPRIPKGSRARFARESGVIGAA